MTTQSSTLPKRGTLILFTVLSACYLVPELIFNSILVSELSVANSAEDLLPVELFGRTISGIGLSLIIASTISIKRNYGPLKSLFIVIPLCMAIFWPLMYYGQHALVENLAQRSSAQERQDGFLSFSLKSALQTGALQIEGAPYKGVKGDNYDDTFLVLIGGLVFANEDILEKFDQNKLEIIKLHYNNLEAKTFDLSYASYKGYQASLRNYYQSYAKQSEQYDQQLAKIPKYQKDYWVEFNNTLRKKYDDLQTYRQAFLGRLSARAQKVAPQIIHAIQYKNSEQGLYYEYKGIMDEIGVDYIKYPIEYWEVSNRQYTSDVDHYFNRFAIMMAPDYLKETGYPLSIVSFNDFLDSDVTSKVARDTLKQSYHLTLPNDWRIEQRQAFYQAVAQRVRQQARAKWDESIKKQNIDIAPSLSWQQFQRTPLVQNFIKNKMASKYIQGMTFDYNDAEFKRKVFDPILRKELLDHQQKLTANVAYFEDNGKLATASKNMLKAVLVPPVSMTISLILFLWTTFSVIRNYFDIKRIKLLEQAELHEIASIEATFTKKKRHALIAYLFIVCILPLWIVPSQIKDNIDTVDKIIGDNFNPLVKGVLVWALEAQPLLQYGGSALNNITGIYDRFKATVEN